LRGGDSLDYVAMMRLGDVGLRAVNAWIRHCTEAATGEQAARETNGERQRNTGQKAEKAAGMRRGSLPSYCAIGNNGTLVACTVTVVGPILIGAHYVVRRGANTVISYTAR